MRPRGVARKDSGVTWAVTMPTRLPEADKWRLRSGVGRDGDPSSEDTESAPEPMKLFISAKAGASTPGSAEVNALTAG